MTDSSPAPEDNASRHPEGNASEGVADKVPSLPASTTDFARFPEKAETVEVTSLMAADAPIPASGEGSPPRPASDLRESDFPSDVDPQIEIIERIGAGGMGEVFLARQKHLGRKVAVKRIRDWGADAATRERFVHEAKAQSRLQHPGIAQVHDLRESGGALYLVMEYVDGQTLEQVLEIRKFTPAEIAGIGIQLTEALEAAAHEGYIHRDLKPGNVMLTASGKIKIIDFGLAILLRNILQTRFTGKGEILGTPAYMSPEQLNQEEHLDIRSDIWSLGVLLYALATGEPPFTGKDFVCTVKNVLMAEPAPLPELEPGFPPGLWAAIKRALQKDRGERWQDYASFREALKGSAGTEASADQESSVPSDRNPLRGAERHFQGIKVALLLAAALVAAIVLAVVLRPSPEGASKSEAAARGPLSEEPSIQPAPRLGLTEEGTGSEPKPLSPTRKAELLPPAAPSAPPAKPTPLRERLVRYALSDEELACTRELLAIFEGHHPKLLAKDFEPFKNALAAFARERLALAPGAPTPPEKEYLAAQIRGAGRMVDLAQGAMSARLAELRSSGEPVTITLGDGGSRTGIVREATGEFVTLALHGGGDLRLPLASIRPESLKGQSAPATAFLALLALSGRSELALPDIVELTKERDDLLFWLPIATRLARLELVAVASEIAAASKTLHLKGSGDLPQERLVRFTDLVRILAESQSSIVRVFPHVGPEFERVKREDTALRLLLEKAWAKVLALGPGTAAFPAAAGILLGGFQAELAKDYDELHARTGWHAYGWQLFPPEAPGEKGTHWDLDFEGEGTLLRAGSTERRIAMGRGAPRATDGVLAVVSFRPKASAGDASHWRFLLRAPGGATMYLRFDGQSCGLYRSRLDVGTSDEKLGEAPLPAAETDLTLALIPLEDQLHVFLDGKHILTARDQDALIPMQMSFAVTEGELSLKSVKVRKSALEEDHR